ncbi:MAG: CPBP family intramembrane metalloprotease [Deltaproteobacteria bacterium]|nr:CPBP family intramembrane metalloprotease [Deltaproteobacteria bacterium]
MSHAPVTDSPTPALSNDAEWLDMDVFRTSDLMGPDAQTVLTLAFRQLADGEHQEAESSFLLLDLNTNPLAEAGSRAAQFMQMSLRTARETQLAAVEAMVSENPTLAPALHILAAVLRSKLSCPDEAAEHLRAAEGFELGFPGLESMRRGVTRALDELRGPAPALARPAAPSPLALPDIPAGLLTPTSLDPDPARPAAPAASPPRSAAARATPRPALRRHTPAKEVASSQPVSALAFAMAMFGMMGVALLVFSVLSPMGQDELVWTLRNPAFWGRQLLIVVLAVVAITLTHPRCDVQVDGFSLPAYAAAVALGVPLGVLCPCFKADTNLVGALLMAGTLVVAHTLVFRILMDRLLAERLEGVVTPTIVSAAAYAGYSLTYGGRLSTGGMATSVLWAFVAGLVFAGLHFRTRSIGPAVAAHAVAMVVFALAITRG